MRDLEKSERAFYDDLLETMRRTGEIGDVFPRMVAYNVPAYVLGVFWPDEKRRLIESGEFPAFCIAETGWKGRIENISSRLSIADGNTLAFEKSYVMECDTMYVVANTDSGLALCRVPRNNSTQTWTSRQEPSVVFKSSDGKVTRDHFIVKGLVTLASNQFLPLSKRQYTVAGITIPRREISGIALLSLALLEHHGISVEEMNSLRSALLQKRTDGLDKDSVTIATEIFRFFQKKAEGISLHPFWERAAGMYRT